MLSLKVVIQGKSRPPFGVLSLVKEISMGTYWNSRTVLLEFKAIPQGRPAVKLHSPLEEKGEGEKQEHHII